MGKKSLLPEPEPKISFWHHRPIRHYASLGFHFYAKTHLNIMQTHATPKTSPRHSLLDVCTWTSNGKLVPCIVLLAPLHQPATMMLLYHKLTKLLPPVVVVGFSRWLAQAQIHNPEVNAQPTRTHSRRTKDGMGE